jgi:hypothetical protein
MRTAIQRRRLGLSLAALTVIIVACPTTGRILPPPVPNEYVQPDTESGGEPATQNPSADSLGGPYSHGRKGAAPHVQTPPAPPGLIAGSVSEADLVSYLNSLNFDKARDNGELAQVRCPTSSGAGCSATLYIQPEVGMRRRRYPDVPPTGMVVARIINYSAAATDTTYKIPPLTRAYWLVYPGSTPLAPKRSRVFIRVPGAVPAMRFLTASDTLYKDCGHYHEVGPATAKFRDCVKYEVSRAGDGIVRGEWSNPFVRALSFIPLPHQASVEPLTDTELWVKCAQGCCVSGT